MIDAEVADQAAKTKLEAATEKVGPILNQLNTAIATAAQDQAPRNLRIRMMTIQTAISWNSEYENKNTDLYQDFITAEEAKLLTRVQDNLRDGQTIKTNPRITRLYAATVASAGSNRRRRNAQNQMVNYDWTVEINFNREQTESDVGKLKSRLHNNSDWESGTLQLVWSMALVMVTFLLR